MSSIQEQKNSSLVNEEELNKAKQIALSFNAAFKYYSLYPEGHAFARNYLIKFKNELDSFLEEYKAIRLDTSKSSFSYKEEMVFQGKAEESNSAYLLSRDRVLFLEFTKNITMGEISQLLDVLKKHRNPLEDDDSDIATTLWHYKFDHMNYEAADIYAMEAIQFELNMFKAAPGSEYVDDGTGATGDSSQQVGSQNRSDGRGDIQEGSAEDGYVQDGQESQGEDGQEGSGHPGHHGETGTQAPSSLFLLSENSGLMELDEKEQKSLDFMVHQAENSDMTSDVIDILLITLSIETDEIDFAAILEFLELEFFDALEREDFVLALKINKNIYNISMALKAKKPWAISLTNLFFSSLGKQDRYQEMVWANEYERIASIPEKNQALLTILKQLSGDSLLILGRLATQIPSDNDSLRKIVSDIIASKAKDDPHSLCKLIEESDEESVLKFLPIVEQMEKKFAAPVYLQMASHSSREIRTTGIHGFFLANTTPKSDDIVQIMQEPEDTLRRIIVSYLEHLDDQLLESILKTFLSEKCAQVNDERYILHCYKLLGNCVSSDSLEFLQRNLLETEIKSMFSHNMKAHKTGSAYALKSLGTSDALMVLEKGAESMRPDVRNICKKLLSN